MADPALQRQRVQLSVKVRFRATRLSAQGPLAVIDGGLLSAISCHWPWLLSPKPDMLWQRTGWRAGGGAMVSITSRLGASSMFSEIDREIAPDKPTVEKLIEIAI